MTVKRRTYVVGIGIGLKPDEIKIEHDLAVVHLGDPPFFMTAAPPDDKREPVINLSDGSFLTDLVWLTPKRAQGRVLFSLIEGAAEAVEHHLDMAESMMDELDGVAAQLDAELDAAQGAIATRTVPAIRSRISSSGSTTARSPNCRCWISISSKTSKGSLVRNWMRTISSITAPSWTKSSRKRESGVFRCPV